MLRERTTLQMNGADPDDAFRHGRGRLDQTGWGGTVIYGTDSPRRMKPTSRADRKIQSAQAKTPSQSVHAQAKSQQQVQRGARIVGGQFHQHWADHTDDFRHGTGRTEQVWGGKVISQPPVVEEPLSDEKPSQEQSVADSSSVVSETDKTLNEKTNAVSSSTKVRDQIAGKRPSQQIHSEEFRHGTGRRAKQSWLSTGGKMIS